MTQESSALDLTDLLAHVRQWCQMHLAVADVAQAEAVAQQVSQAAAAVVWAEGLAQCGTRAGYQGSQRPCVCGCPARFVGYRSRWLRGRWGEAQVSRAYYHCAACQQGSVPWDQQQGLTDRLWTPGVKALVAELCAHVPYRDAGTFLHRHLDLELAESSLEALVAEVGSRIREQETARITRCFDAGEEIAPEPGVPPLGVPGSAPLPRRLYLGIDAAKAHVAGSWHDVKCATLYLAAAAKKGGKAAPDPRWDRAGPQRYVACQEPAATFGPRVYVAACQSGLAQVQEVVVLGDGAEWIWNLAAEHFHGATEILDYWHACEYLWKLVPVLYGEGSARGRQWAECRCRDLQEHGPAGLLRALRRRQAKTPGQQEALRLALGYFTQHRQRMCYPAFRQRGLMIGSGPVEAACKSVVGQRLKGTGMRWSPAGADAMLAVRTLVLSGQAEHLTRYARAA